MDIRKVRKYSCVVCGLASIEECKTEHTYEGEVPDQSNCDFSTYSGYAVIGGILLEKREVTNWKIDPTNTSEVTAGGICTTCFNIPAVKILHSLGHIRVAEYKVRTGFIRRRSSA